MHTGYKSVSAEPCCLIDSFQVWWQYSKMGKKKNKLTICKSGVRQLTWFVVNITNVQLER